MSQPFGNHPLVKRAVHAGARTAITLGLGDRRLHLLSVEGLPYEVPVTLVAARERRWLVAPFGESAWVRAAREAGRVRLRRGRRRWEVPLEQADPDTAAHVLRAYLVQVPLIRPHVQIQLDDPHEALVEAAPRHPVFATPVPA